MKISDFFNKQEKENITLAIKEAELNTSGEIRIHIEGKCKEEVMDRAVYIFEKLGMHKTELRNGVLFYLAVNDHKFAILGDAGINQVVPDDFWDEIKKSMLDFFSEKQFSEGLSRGIKMAGEQLKNHFPYQEYDINELPDEISFGKV
ncbi:MAG: TPM domain-containing protein [Bacteroidales bacterium]|nr:TPM domain-containing protein [Bacteroidales bacterium]